MEVNQGLLDLVNAYSRWVGSEKIKRQGLMGYEPRRPLLQSYNMYPWAKIDKEKEVLNEKLNIKHEPLKWDDKTAEQKPESAVSKKLYLLLVFMQHNPLTPLYLKVINFLLGLLSRYSYRLGTQFAFYSSRKSIDDLEPGKRLGCTTDDGSEKFFKTHGH